MSEQSQEDPQGQPGQDPEDSVGADKETQPAPEEMAKELGFASVAEAMKSMKHKHGELTRLYQEKKQWEQEREELTATNLGQGQGASQGWQSGDQTDPTLIATRAAQQAIFAKEVRDALKAESPTRQQKLRKTMFDDLMAHPHLEHLPDPVGTLLKRAKDREEAEKAELVRSMFGEDVQLDKLKELLSKGDKGDPKPSDDRLNAGYMPDAGPPSTGKSSGKSREDKERERYKTAIESGDVETVTDFVFRDTKNIMPGDGRKI